MYPNQHVAGRSLALAVGKLLFLAIAHFPTTYAFPILGSLQLRDQGHGNSSDDPGLWLNLSVAAALVISGGAFAGLTIALMGQV